MKKLLCIIGAGPDQEPAFTLAKSMNLETIAIDINPHAPAMKIANYKLVVSTKNIPEIIKQLEKFQQQIRPLDGVITIAAEVSPTVAAIAEKFNLAGVSPKTALNTTNKCLRAKIFSEENINFPQYTIGTTPSQFTNAKFPAVIKPSDNSASRGVIMVNNFAEFEKQFPTSQKLSSDNQIILEQYIPGEQISIEGVVINKKLFVTAIADRNYIRNPQFYPYFVEDGGEMPSHHNKQTIQNIITEFNKAVQALNIHTGPTKGDIIISPNGKIYVIEVTSRLSGGGFCSRVVPMTTGINIVKTVIQLAIGITPDLIELKPKFNKGMCHRFYFHKPGKIKKIIGLNNIKKMPGVVDFVIQRPFKIGDILEPASYANRLFYIITIAKDRTTATKQANNAIASIKIITE